jgi:hypothetical protein
MPMAASERYGTVANNASAMPRATRGVFEQMMRTARKGARICSRGILRHRNPPAEFAAHLRREPELEREFARDDASMVHEFMVGELP